MLNSKMLVFGPFGVFTKAPAEDVTFVPQGGDADPGAVRSTARIEVNSLRVTAFAEEDTLTYMPDCMAESIGSLHANIGCEHGVVLREDKTSTRLHDSPAFSSQADLESVAGNLPRVGLGDLGKFNRYYLWRDDNVKYVGETLITDDYLIRESNSAKSGVNDSHFIVPVNFVLIDHELASKNDIHVQGHTGNFRIYDGSGNYLLRNRYVSEFSMWKTEAVTFSYEGNIGNNTFDMTWGFFTIDVSRGGNNTITITDSVAREIIGGGGDDTIYITGHGAAAERIDLRNGGNNSIHTEVWADIIGGAGNDTIFSQPTFENDGYGIHADLSAGGDNLVTLQGAASSVTVGAGNDTVVVSNQWHNGGLHGGNWSSATIDLSLGGTNSVVIWGSGHTSGPTRAEITLGCGTDTILAHDYTVVTILGASSTGNHNITLNGTAGRQGEVHTGHGHTTIGWYGGDYVFEFGSGDLTFTTGGDLHHCFVFNGADRTANDTLILNNWREGGVVHTGQGHTDVTLNYGIYDFHLGSGGVSMSVNGHDGFSTIYDADGNLIVGRVDGQSSLAQAVHTFSAREGINLQYSLQFGGGVDKVQFYAGSGHYQVTSSANRDIFQLDFMAGGTVGATYEVFDFKWGSDRIMDETGGSMDEIVFSDVSDVRFQYLGERAEGHAFDLIAVADVGNYQAGHVWMTVYSHDLPDLNFL